MSKAVTVSIQGVSSSFHDIAARQFFGEDLTIIPCETFKETFQALSDKKCDYAVVAIENSLYGSINEVYDLFLKHGGWIVGEVYLRIAQCLIGLPEATLEAINEVHSHPVALAQCEDFLDEKLPHAARFEHHDTAGSVVDIKKWNDPTKAAIASKEAAEEHNLQILAEEIESNKQNYTRFVIVAREQTAVDEANKTSIVLTTPADTRPVALHRALGIFADKDINLLLLHSRPIIGKAWHYMFYLDVGAGITEPHMTAALDELTMQGCTVSVLGSYKAGR